MKRHWYRRFIWLFLYSKDLFIGSVLVVNLATGEDPVLIAVRYMIAPASLVLAVDFFLWQLGKSGQR